MILLLAEHPIPEEEQIGISANRQKEVSNFSFWLLHAIGLCLMQCIFRSNMADNINTPGVATPNEGMFVSFYVLF